ncbi:recombinase family protein [Peptoniphilus indolicus]|uniref:Resolvase, N terminal domain n=2 Tax=Peptoniphilus indolicus TaxID=33030 RepID=A0A379DFF1_9FIRM|nr:recombinase family protein [Peptoniphilus indolicus]SUB76295.1 Resolvase, N terminal domain [Peptoniphilus indolicus]
MARTANRRMKSEEQLINKESINSFQTAIYARTSRDKKEKPSDSIENQIALCESFIQKSEDFSLAGIYKDIAKTGTDFERPDFENLMDEVRMGKVNCIVVKDLSRFGRNYTELCKCQYKNVHFCSNNNVHFLIPPYIFSFVISFFEFYF